MKSREETLGCSVIDEGPGALAAWRGLSRPERLRIGGLIGWNVVVTLVFVQPLTRLMLHAAQSELLSYIPLVPFVAVYLLYIRRRTRLAVYRSSIGGAVISGGIGLTALAAG